jgi:hypothetical protein
LAHQSSDPKDLSHAESIGGHTGRRRDDRDAEDERPCRGRDLSSNMPALVLGNLSGA